MIQDNEISLIPTNTMASGGLFLGAVEINADGLQT